ncbi:protein LURP-one-related 5-like [Cornus florida]|uniref:protein LURP-one-related 5-like n=1 Tax=Cornus florida TaxID=4283 RepID=UPI00289DC835|nr:protein LURP-one-related 5-like [Cornus florida]
MVSLVCSAHQIFTRREDVLTLPLIVIPDMKCSPLVSGDELRLSSLSSLSSYISSTNFITFSLTKILICIATHREIALKPPNNYFRRMKGGFVVEDRFMCEEETHLTVLKTSLFFADDGFTVYDSKGELVLRVDSYGGDARDKADVVLMEASGRCLLTVRRKRPSLHHRWEGFLGEKTEGQQPIFSVRRSSMMGRRSSMTVEVGGDAGEEYQIEGSFSQRSCTIYNAAKESMAEIRRKVDASAHHVVLGKEVFSLCVKPGFDSAFAMGLVLVLDQIHGDDWGDEGSVGSLDPTSVESESA